MPYNNFRRSSIGGNREIRKTLIPCLCLLPALDTVLPCQWPAGTGLVGMTEKRNRMTGE